MQKFNNPSNQEVPFPHIGSWMHERCQVPKKTAKEIVKSWEDQSTGALVLESILSRIAKRLGLFNSAFRPVTYRIFRKVVRTFFVLQHRFRAKGIDKIPQEGAIFYVNHPGSYDPLILISALPFQVSGFVSWGNGWFMETIERYFGYVSRNHRLSRRAMVEKMLRVLLTKNRYFAIWPEGHPTKHGFVKEGFSSVARLYAAANSGVNRVPFVPVLIRGSGIYKYEVTVKRGPIEIEFLNPFYLPRSWLKTPQHGGKTPREITDYIMTILAKKSGQKSLLCNCRLEMRRAYYKRNSKE